MSSIAKWKKRIVTAIHQLGREDWDSVAALVGTKTNRQCAHFARNDETWLEVSLAELQAAVIAAPTAVAVAPPATVSSAAAVRRAGCRFCPKPRAFPR